MVTCKKHQPISFESTDCEPLESNYCVPVEFGDTTKVQFELSAAEDINMISNGTFASSSGWTLPANWSISGGVATCTSPVLTYATMYTEMDYDAHDGYYFVELDFIVGTGQIDLEIYIGDVLVLSAFGRPTKNQRLRSYKVVTGATDKQVDVRAYGNFSIDNLVIKKMSEVQYEIMDCDTEQVLYSSETATYFETSTLTIGSSPFYSENHVGYATISINWTATGLSAGCYCLCIKDKGKIEFERIRNGTFTTATLWTITNTGSVGWGISGGQATHTGEASGGEDYIDHALSQTLNPALTYNLTLNVNLGVNPEDDLKVYIDSTESGALFLLSTISDSTSGTVTISFTGYSVTKITFGMLKDGDGSIDNVSIQLNETSYACDCNSRCISLRSDWGTIIAGRKMCDYIVEGTNTQAAFGFNFDSFTLKGRVFGIIRNAKYTNLENILYKDLTGAKTLQYADVEKTSEFQIFAVPEYVHDWLSVALSCETVNITVNGTTKQYNKIGDYIPDWRKSSPDAPCIVEIQEADQLPPNAQNI